VRLIDSDGGQLGVFITREALRRAEEAGLDLVEISPMARPPVCKIMDYGKFKYEQSKKMHDQKKKQTVIHIKEIKMRPSTDEHDFQTKVRHVRRFLEEGNKVKITIRFRGREMAHVDLGHDRMKRLLETVKDLGEAEAYPKMEGRQLFMMVTPMKGKEKAKEKAPAPVQRPESRPGKRKLEVEVHSRPVADKQAETK
jgi:translation initiation factor IF-3